MSGRHICWGFGFVTTVTRRSPLVGLGGNRVWSPKHASTDIGIRMEWIPSNCWASNEGLNLDSEVVLETYLVLPNCLLRCYGSTTVLFSRHKISLKLVVHHMVATELRSRCCGHWMSAEPLPSMANPMHRRRLCSSSYCFPGNSETDFLPAMRRQ